MYYMEVMRFTSEVCAACHCMTGALQPICDAEIRAYDRSRDVKPRLRARGEKYVKSRGLNPSDPAALCKLGPTEIARSSRIGVFLKAK